MDSHFKVGDIILIPKVETGQFKYTRKETRWGRLVGVYNCSGACQDCHERKILIVRIPSEHETKAVCSKKVKNLKKRIEEVTPYLL